MEWIECQRWELEKVREKLVEIKDWLHLYKVLDRYNTLFIKFFGLEEHRKIRERLNESELMIDEVIKIIEKRLKKREDMKVRKGIEEVRK